MIANYALSFASACICKTGNCETLFSQFHFAQSFAGACYVKERKGIQIFCAEEKGHEWQENEKTCKKELGHRND